LKTLQRTVHFPDSDPSDGPGSEDELLTLAAIQRHLDPYSMSVEDMVFERIFRDQILSFVSQLSQRERLILFLRFEMQWTLNQIAEFIHVKPPRVHQILQSIFRKCRYAFDGVYGP
jgi:RNA polymerase sigma factor (sigma-70 family)